MPRISNREGLARINGVPINGGARINAPFPGAGNVEQGRWEELKSQRGNPVKCCVVD